MRYRYEFAGPVLPMGVRSAVDIAEPLRLYAGRWPWRIPAVDEPAAAAPQIDIAADGSRGALLHIVAEPQLRQSAASPLQTAAMLVDMLARQSLLQLGSCADLHAGAAIVDGRLVVLPGASLAGKSTLALQLAARGHMLAGDDRLLIGPLGAAAAGSRIEGMALGLNARMRLPLHPAAGAEFAAFVGARLLSSPGLPSSIGFVRLQDGEAAGFGHRAPLAAFVLPERCESGGIALAPAASSQVMRLLLEQSHAPHLPVATLVAAARAMAETVPAFVLRYDDSARAAHAVEELARGGLRSVGQ